MRRWRTEMHGRLGKNVLKVDAHVRRALVGKSNMIALIGVRMQLGSLHVSLTFSIEGVGVFLYVRYLS